MSHILEVALTPDSMEMLCADFESPSLSIRDLRSCCRGGRRDRGWPDEQGSAADRRNNRVQVFDQDGHFIAAWKQFGQPSSVYVDSNDNIYIGATYESVAPGETALRPTAGPNDRAIVIGNAITGELKS